MFLQYVIYEFAAPEEKYLQDIAIQQRENPAPFPLYPPLITHWLALAGTQASVVRDLPRQPWNNLIEKLLQISFSFAL
jgi:hypothetical protein